MEAIFFFGLIIAALAAFDLAALRFGVDSRQGFADRRAPDATLTI